MIEPVGMKVNDLRPGMLLEPKHGFSWYEVPWRGYDGKIAGYYLRVRPTGLPVKDSKHPHRTSVVYVGEAERNNDGHVHTPGRQRVLAWGDVLNIEPKSWKYIQEATGTAAHIDGEIC